MFLDCQIKADIQLLLCVIGDTLKVFEVGICIMILLRYLK